MESAEITAVFASAVAVTTSIASLAVSIMVARRDRPHLTVSAHWAQPVENMAAVHLAVTAVNTGRYREIVTHFGLFDDTGRHCALYSHVHFQGRTPPIAIDPGDSVTAWVPVDRIHKDWEGMGRPTYVRAFVKSDREYKTEMPWRIRHLLTTGELVAPKRRRWRRG